LRCAARHPGEHGATRILRLNVLVGLLMVAGAIYFAAVRLILRHVWPRGTVWIVLGVAVSLRVLTLAAPPILARTNETPLWYA
jgi:hypothetical protein